MTRDKLKAKREKTKYPLAVGSWKTSEGTLHETEAEAIAEQTNIDLRTKLRAFVDKHFHPPMNEFDVEETLFEARTELTAIFCGTQGRPSKAS
jgi:hypothetical protein